MKTKITSDNSVLILVELVKSQHKVLKSLHFLEELSQLPLTFMFI